jgi:putative endonuclease
MSRSHRLGSDGEDVVAHHYRRDGYEIVARNWRCPSGELDIVARRGSLIVFCEVKTRSTDRFGGGAAAVDDRRRRRLRRAAASFLRSAAERGHGRLEVRFDVAVVRPGTHGFSIERIEAAF